jgi:hypothetical protein
MKRDIVKRALAGENFSDLNIVDAHCHMNQTYGYYFPHAGIEEMMEEAESIGIQNICLFPHEGISYDETTGNENMKKAVEKYPGRVYGLITINPNKPDNIDKEFEKYYAMDNVLGIKLHPSAHNYMVTGKNYKAAFDRVRKMGGIIITHSWQTDPTCSVEMCIEVIREYPDIPFVIAHSGGTREGVIKAAEAVNNYENAYLDTCGVFGSLTSFEEITDMTERSKILYASDFPYHDVRGELCRVLLADINDDIKLDILGNNFRKMVSKSEKRMVDTLGDKENDTKDM